MGAGENEFYDVLVSLKQLQGLFINSLLLIIKHHRFDT
jgi:hypothetical protein